MSRTGTTTVPAGLDRTPDDDARIGVGARAIRPWVDGMGSDGSPGTYEIRFLVDDSYRSIAASANFKVVKP